MQPTRATTKLTFLGHKIPKDKVCKKYNESDMDKTPKTINQDSLHIKPSKVFQ